MRRAVWTWLGMGLALSWLSLACGPSAAPTAPTPEADAFAVVRATSQAGYLAGQTAIARGDFLQACVELDRARTNDPDNRPEIQQALGQALAHCLTPVAQVTLAPAAAQQRTLAVATLAAGVGTAVAGTTQGTPPSTAGGLSVPTLGGVPTLSSVPTAPAAAATATAQANPPQAAGTIAVATPPANPAQAAGTSSATATPPANPPSGAITATALNATPGTPPAAGLITWNDPQARFSIGAPANWTRIDQPQSLVGSGVVAFRDPSGQAEVDVAIDSSTRAVSPELYAAGLELAMQRQVPGYASEQIVPGTTSNAPSVRRVFTFTQRDANGQDHQARGFQQAIVKGSTPYLISGTAPADQYQQFGPTFDQIVESFRFS